MSKPYTEENLSDQLNSDLIWRIKELSDIKLSIKEAKATSRPALLRSLITMTYAHWEGFIKFSAEKYFQFISLKKLGYKALEDQIYYNFFISRLNKLYLSKSNITNTCNLIEDILTSKNKKFSRINPDLIDTKSNLNTDTIKDLCIICSIDYEYFENKRSYIDIRLLKRRNAIAHGQQQEILETEMDEFVSETINLMRNFKSLLENKIYTESYKSNTPQTQS